MTMDNDDDLANLKPKKEKIIQPLEGSSNKSTAPEIPGASDDLLAELREKTAKLAAQVHGREGAQNRTLKLDDESVEEDDIIEALKQDRPDKPFNDPEISGDKTASSNPAVELVRAKLSKLYKKEPDAAEEAIEAYQVGSERSKHQEFMYNLTTSGKSLADIQTEWHKYYTELPDDEKHQVWQEFYDTQGKSSNFTNSQQHQQDEKTNKTSAPANRSRRNRDRKPQSTGQRTVGDIKAQLLDRVNAGGKLTVVQHAKSLLFGLSLATFVGLIITFTFFNEVFIAPFISPSKSVSATPIIGNQAGEVGPEPKIIIPKINLEVPVVFDMTTVEEKAVQNALEDGVVHYASTPNPGEKGNAVIVGHSSNNILNSGKYKFAFVLLKRLEPDDTFFVQKDGVRYTYKVYEKEIVGPDDVSVLDQQERANTITLITCDPPGTSINRLIIVAEQISPDPNSNKASTAIKVSETETLPSNAPSLWSRLWPF